MRKPTSCRGGLWAVQQRDHIRAVIREITEHYVRVLAVVPVAVALGLALQIVEVSVIVVGERSVKTLSGSRERRQAGSNYPGSKSTTQEVAALHRVITIVCMGALRDGGRGELLPGSRT
ncbi:hypothetical protein ABZ746_25940 [Streptomyces sp. NPDC020096]